MPRWRENHSDKPIIHADSANGDDRTLCGVILEGIEGDNQMVEVKSKINCADCIGIIEHCRHISSRSFVPRGASVYLACEIEPTYSSLVARSKQMPEPDSKVPLSQVGLAMLHLWDMFSLDDNPEAWIAELEAADYGVLADALREANANQ